MYQVLTYFAAEHDVRVVFIAALSCFLLTLFALNLISRARRSRGRARTKALVAAAMVGGCGIWTAHFLAMHAITSMHLGGWVADAAPTVMSPVRVFLPLIVVVVITSVAFALVMSSFAVAISAGRWEISTAASEKKFGLLVQGVGDYAIYMLDPDGIVTNWNTGAERAKGYTEQEIVGRHFACFYTQEDQHADLPALNLKIAAEAGKFDGEGWRLRKDGTRLWAHVVIEALRTEGGELIGFAKITRDRTEQMQSEEKLKKASEDLQLALMHMGNALCLFDEDGRLTMYNGRLNEIVGIDASIDLMGRTLDELCFFNPENADARFSQYKKLLSQGGGETIVELASGKMIRVSCVPTNTKAWVLTIEDVTMRVQSERRIAHMARHDVLTGLPNRRQFIETLDEAISEADVIGTKVSVINIDLDRFKDINDTYGHAAGDTVLCVLSKRMRRGLRQGEMVGRFGGDEFVAMKSYGDATELQEFIGRLRKALTENIDLDMVAVTPGASLGVAIYPVDATDREKLLGNADMAMYRAKENFTEAVCFYEASMDELERARRTLALDIWTGLKEGQFFLNYQVQRAAHTHQVTGYEVLLRWKHPVLGIVPPGTFIPIAEECGAIAALGGWVLEQACRDAASWPFQERIAVNLSPLQLGNAQLVEKVRSVLLETGLSPERLELEVTESAIISDRQRALHILRQLKAMGITIAIDDFGIGYSSLETLRAFPFDKIKVDRSFVAGLETDKQSRAFIRAILALGKSLEIPVLAEGIETEAQMTVLTQEGCDLFQGYYFGRPAMLSEALSGDEPVRKTA
jgi:diguanylate cyclase (GGDEF)-like protein/PAS domain S-box-containing protein